MGIKKVDQLSIYNRLGQLIYTSNDMFAGWDGRWKGAEQPTGVYIWNLKALDYSGKIYNISGSFTLIR